MRSTSTFLYRAPPLNPGSSGSPFWRIALVSLPLSASTSIVSVSWQRAAPSSSRADRPSSDTSRDSHSVVRRVAQLSHVPLHSAASNRSAKYESI